MTDIKDLPQGDEVYLVLIRKARGFLEDQGKQHRPYIIFLYEIAPRTALLEQDIYMELGQFPASKIVLEMIEKQVRVPKEGIIKRPHSVIFTSPLLYKDLGAPLLKHTITTKLWTEEENQGFGDDILIAHCDRLRTKVSKERAESFFQAAAAFRKETPWESFTAKETFSIASPDAPGIRLAFLAAGSSDGSGITVGLETDLVNLKVLYEKGERAVIDDANETTSHRCILFTNEFGMPFEDLDDIDKNKWPLASTYEDCYPFPFLFKRDIDEGLFRPSKSETEWYEVVLRAMTTFVRDWRSGKINDSNCRDVRFTVSSWNKAYRIQFGYWKFDLQALHQAWSSIESFAQPEATKPAPEMPLMNIVEGVNCIACGKKEDIVEGVTLKNCGGCKKKLYCSRDCQAKDWNVHKTKCKKLTIVSTIAS